MSEIQEEVGLLNIDKEDTSQQDQQETVPHKIEEQSARKTVGEALEGVAEESAQDALEKPDYISDKHWDVKNGIKIEELANSHNELLKKMSMGGHKAPDKYSLEVLEGIDEQDPLAQKFLKWADTAKPTQEVFDNLVNMFKETAQESEEQDMINVDEEVKKLGPNAEQIITANQAWIKGQVDKGIFGPADIEELEILGATANGLRVLNKLRGLTGEQSIPVSPMNVEGITSKDDLYDMVSDPRYKTDAKFRREVEAKFNQAFPGEQQPRT
jgi:hypothetical protein